MDLFGKSAMLKNDNVRMHAPPHVNTYIRACVRTYVHMYVRMNGRTDVQTYGRTDILSAPPGVEVSVPSRGRCPKGGDSNVSGDKNRDRHSYKGTSKTA